MRISYVLLTGITLTVLAAPTAAQSRGLIVSGRGGGFSGLTDLSDSPAADLKTGFNVGGTVAVQLHKYLAVRGDFTFARSELRANAVETGIHLNKFFYGGAIQAQYPTTSGLTPYVFGGGGAVTIHEENTTGQNKTKGAGSFGVGLSYRIPRTRFEVFAEGTGLVYQHKPFSGSTAGFSKTQVDATYSGGISYRIGL